MHKNNRRKFIPKRSFPRNRNFRPRGSYNRKIVSEYFHKKDNFNWQIKVIVLFLIFVAFYLVYLFLFSNQFIVKQVVIEGNKEIPRIEIENMTNNLLNKKKYFIFNNNNYFLFNLSTLEKELLANYSLKSLKVNKRYFSAIFINLEEKPCKFIYEMNENKFLIDNEGFVISQVNEDYKNSHMIIKEVPEMILTNEDEVKEQELKIVKDNELYQNTSSTVFVSSMADDGIIIKEENRIQKVLESVYPEYPEIDTNVFDQDTLERIMYLDSAYNEKFSQQKRNYYEYKNKKQNFITLTTTENIKIYFEINDNLDGQLFNLYRYIVEEKNYDLVGIEYIDLRQKNQIIVK